MKHISPFKLTGGDYIQALSIRQHVGRVKMCRLGLRMWIVNKPIDGYGICAHESQIEEREIFRRFCRMPFELPERQSCASMSAE